VGPHALNRFWWLYIECYKTHLISLCIYFGSSGVAYAPLCINTVCMYALRCCAVLLAKRHAVKSHNRRCVFKATHSMWSDGVAPPYVLIILLSDEESVVIMWADIWGCQRRCEFCDTRLPLHVTKPQPSNPLAATLWHTCWPCMCVRRAYTFLYTLQTLYNIYVHGLLCTTITFKHLLNILRYAERGTSWHSASWNSVSPLCKNCPKKLHVIWVIVNNECVLDAVLHINWNLVALSVTIFSCDPRPRKLQMPLTYLQIILIGNTERSEINKVMYGT
jgi:hypothetical protein